MDPLLANPAAVASLIVSVVTGVGFIWAIRTSVQVLDARLNAQDRVISELRAEMVKLNDIITRLAVQHQRLETIEERQLHQGKRLDEALSRFNVWMDRRGTDKRPAGR